MALLELPLGELEKYPPELSEPGDFDAFNHYGALWNVDQAGKEIRAYPFNDHVGGSPAHEVVKLEWPGKQWGKARAFHR
ncbi:hypothetical protein [Streptomyces sp. AC154]|uniref:hypothetical protein n=1 Tax=Streptomyces sp. AC154 TaxID=3143184 RepID=UPI003F7DFFF8